MYTSISVPPIGHLPGGDFNVAWLKTGLVVFCLVYVDDDDLRKFQDSSLCLYNELRDEKKRLYGEKINFRIIVEEETMPLFGEQQWELKPIYRDQVMVSMERADVSKSFLDDLKASLRSQ